MSLRSPGGYPSLRQICASHSPSKGVALLNARISLRGPALSPPLTFSGILQSRQDNLGQRGTVQVDYFWLARYLTDKDLLPVENQSRPEERQRGRDGLDRGRDRADADSSPCQRTPLRMKNGRKSSRSFKFLRTIAPYQQVISSDASFLGSCAVGVPLSI